MPGEDQRSKWRRWLGRFLCHRETSTGRAIYVPRRRPSSPIRLPPAAGERNSPPTPPRRLRPHPREKSRRIPSTRLTAPRFSRPPIRFRDFECPRRSAIGRDNIPSKNIRAHNRPEQVWNLQDPESSNLHNYFPFDPVNPNSRSLCLWYRYDEKIRTSPRTPQERIRNGVLTLAMSMRNTLNVVTAKSVRAMWRSVGRLNLTPRPMIDRA